MGAFAWDDALGADDLVGLLERLRRSEVSTAELREAALRRAHRWEPHLGAVAAWTDDLVVPEADETAPFGGVPVLVKDNEDVVGYPTSYGSLAVHGRPVSVHSPAVAQLLDIGFDPIAKTTLPEFGLTATTESTRYGPTRNPWDLRHSVGGSSGGSAAMVAAGVVPLAHANDGGGSIRIPAACCGLVGLKPTRGRLPDRPEMRMLPVNITTQGVLTTSVRDTARFYAVAEQQLPSRSLPPIGDVRGPSPTRLRIGVVRTGGLRLPVGRETSAALDGAADLLASLGHDVDETEPPVSERFALDFLHFWSFIAFMVRQGGTFVYGSGFDRDTTETITNGLGDRFLRNKSQLPGALRRLRQVARQPEERYKRFDAFISPVLGHEAPPIGYLGPDVEYHTHLRRLVPFTSFTPLENVTGAPAISLPLGRSAAGLPIGIQVSAPFGHERRLLELSYEMEAAAPWPRVTPVLPR